MLLQNKTTIFVDPFLQKLFQYLWSKEYFALRVIFFFFLDGNTAIVQILLLAKALFLFLNKKPWLKFFFVVFVLNVDYNWKFSLPSCFCGPRLFNFVVLFKQNPIFLTMVVKLTTEIGQCVQF